MESLERSLGAAGIAGRLIGASLLAVASGMAAAQTGTITFQGAIANPTCGFRPDAGQVQATCLQPSGGPHAAPLPLPPRLTRPARIGIAQLHIETVPDRSRTGAREVPGGYVMEVTYQ
ncbi:hypothetical protein [Cupriavidus necator]|uniref:hypothetical protein n=1 Tax=Cupriavidus necator TaxID=106590 RepID=UPI0005B3E824|nr:hypothetical protein [Cupriavidus necator]